MYACVCIFLNKIQDMLLLNSTIINMDCLAPPRFGQLNRQTQDMENYSTKTLMGWYAQTSMLSVGNIFNFWIHKFRQCSCKFPKSVYLNVVKIYPCVIQQFIPPVPMIIPVTFRNLYLHKLVFPEIIKYSLMTPHDNTNRGTIGSCHGCLPAPEPMLLCHQCAS